MTALWGDFENHPASFLATLGNALDDATLSTNSAGDITRAFDWRAYTHFEGAAGDEITADFGAARELSALGLLDPVGTVALHWSDDDVTYTPVLTGLAASRVLFEPFTAQAHRYWRVSFSGTGGGAAVIWLGDVFYGPGQRGGFKPPEFADEVIPQVNLSATGVPLGNRVQRAVSRFQLTAEPLTYGQVATAFQPLRDHAKAGLPFFLKWHAARPAAFCWVEAKPQPVAFADPKFLGGSLDVAAIVEGVTP